jgi:putative membrane protein insertion efficiency factor
MKRLLLALIRYYQRAVSPGLPAACKYQPTCSRYASQAIERFGVLRGCLMAARRLLRCMPWSAGGFDPVPGTEETSVTATMQNERAAPAGGPRLI